MHSHVSLFFFVARPLVPFVFCRFALTFLLTWAHIYRRLGGLNDEAYLPSFHWPTSTPSILPVFCFSSRLQVHPCLVNGSVVCFLLVASRPFARNKAHSCLSCKPTLSLAQMQVHSRLPTGLVVV